MYWCMLINCACECVEIGMMLRCLYSSTILHFSSLLVQSENTHPFALSVGNLVAMGIYIGLITYHAWDIDKSFAIAVLVLRKFWLWGRSPETYLYLKYVVERSPLQFIVAVVLSVKIFHWRIQSYSLISGMQLVNAFLPRISVDAMIWDMFPNLQNSPKAFLNHL